MAGDWLKWSKGFADKREVRVLCRKLGVDVGTVVVGCFRIWEWADDETADGHVRGATGDDIDSIARVPGIAAALATVDVNWIRITDQGITFPNFGRHNGETAKTRAVNTKRKQKQRASRDCHDSVPDLSQVCPTKSVTREEKRREEKDNSSSPTRGREETFRAVEKPPDRPPDGTEPKHPDQLVQHVCDQIARSKRVPALLWARNEPQTVAGFVDVWRQRPSPTIHGVAASIDEVVRRASVLFGDKGSGGSVRPACKWIDEVIDVSCREGLWPGERRKGNEVGKTVEPDREPVKFKVPDGYKGPM